MGMRYQCVVDVEDERAVVGGDKTGVGTLPRFDDGVAVLEDEPFVCSSSRVPGSFETDRTTVTPKINSIKM